MGSMGFSMPRASRTKGTATELTREIQRRFPNEYNAIQSRRKAKAIADGKLFKLNMLFGSDLQNDADVVIEGNKKMYVVR